jgi:hypothetical protein
VPALRLGPLAFLDRSPVGGEALDGLAVPEVGGYDLGYVSSVQAQVPGSAGVDDSVGAVLAEAQAIDGVHADVAVHVGVAQLALEGLAEFAGAAFLAVLAFADQDVRVVVPDLRRPGLSGLLVRDWWPQI